tara:strand:- start:3607 stop:5322 length:1716 start_codon:yes stop_codon:yes gene_type:complete
MNIEKIVNICGEIPQNFSKFVPSDTNFIFKKDINFTPINLNDFFGRAATVNSFKECYYYVELGFEPNKLTFLDIILGTALAFFAFVIIYVINKKQILKKILNIIQKITYNIARFRNSNPVNTIVGSKRNYYVISYIALLVNIIISFEYIKSKSIRLPSFIDEYITLASNVNFFRSLDFNAGVFIGGNYSVQITSGPVSAIGKVIGWLLTFDFRTARLANFIWIVLLQLIFLYILHKKFKLKSLFLLNCSTLVIFLIPWWQGALYSIGEIPSAIIFTNAIFLFHQFRKTSIMLFAISILYGKFLTLLPFIGFYIPVLLKEKKLENIIRDTLLFLASSMPWLLLVKIKYENKSIRQYIIDQYYFITEHKTSGASSTNEIYFQNFMSNLLNSEFGSWNSYEKIRVFVIPIILLIIFYINKDNINNFFGYIAQPLITSSLFIYIWFLFFNSTKWIRHTQHFIVPILIALIYFLNYEIFKNKYHIIAAASCLLFYIDNNKNLIPTFIFIVIITTIFVSDINYLKITKLMLITFLLIEFTIPYYETRYTQLNQSQIVECIENIESNICRETYLKRYP